MLNKNPSDNIQSGLGNLHNKQMKLAIIEIQFFGYIYGYIWDRMEIMGSKPRFSWSRNIIIPVTSVWDEGHLGFQDGPNSGWQYLYDFGYMG